MSSIFPVGFHFDPLDHELVFHYLYQKAAGKTLPCEHVVAECDLYGDRDPWEIFEGSTERVRYFFTKLKKKTSNGSRVDRTVGSGTWKGQDVGELVFDTQNRHIGRKKLFVYERKGGGTRSYGRWIMHEYGLDGFLLQEIQCEDLVLCRIKKKAEKEENNIKGSKIQQPPKHPVHNQTIEEHGLNSTPSPKAEQIVEFGLTTSTSLPDSGTLEPEHTANDQMIALGLTTFPDLVEPEGLFLDEIFPEIGDQQLEHIFTSDNGAAWAPSYVGDYTLNSLLPLASAPPLSTESQPVYLVEFNSFDVGENLFGSTKEEMGIMLPTTPTSVPCPAPKSLSAIGCTGDDGTPILGREMNFGTQWSKKDVDFNYTDWVMNFSNQLMWNQKEFSTQENGIDLLQNMDCEENWEFKLKKRRIEQESPTW